MAEKTLEQELQNKIKLLEEENTLLSQVIESLPETIKKQIQAREQEASVLYIAQDIKAQTEKETRQLVDFLTNDAAHDLRTPLTSIYMCIDKLNESLQPLIAPDSETNTPQSSELELINERLEKLKKLSRNMKGSIDTMLSFMRKMAKDLWVPEDYVICDMQGLLDDVVTRYSCPKEEYRLMECNVIDNFDFLGVPYFFYQMMYNLIGNSLDRIRLHQKGKIEITVEIKDKKNILRFRDSAGGAPSDLADQIWSNYQILDGMGIRVAACKQIMAKLQGEIICHAVPDEYIEFVLTFPPVSREGKKETIK